MKIATLQQNVVLPLRQNWKVTPRPYVMVYLKCKGDNMHPAKSLLEFVSFWGAAKREHTCSYLCKKPQNEPSSPNCALKETPFSSLHPSSCTWPLLIRLGVLHSCSQPHFPLLEPARKLKGSLSGCRRSGGSGGCTPSSPFWTLWLLPHWTTNLSNLPWSALKGTRGGSGTPPVPRLIGTCVLFICCFRDPSRAQQASGSTSTRARFVRLKKEWWNNHLCWGTHVHT